MTDKFDFDDIASDAVKNEPAKATDPRAQEILKNDSENDKNDKNDFKNDSGNDSEEQFEANAYDLVPSLIEGFAVLWRKLWGEGEGAKLNEAEKNDLISLLQGGCNHFGLIKYISGTKGFIISLMIKIISIIIPRMINNDSRNHFKEKFSHEKKEQEEDATESGVKYFRHDEDGNIIETAGSA